MFSSCINGVVTGWGTVDSLWKKMANPHQATSNLLTPASKVLTTVIDKVPNNFFLFKIIFGNLYRVIGWIRPQGQGSCELILGFMIGFTNANKLSRYFLGVGRDLWETGWNFWNYHWRIWVSM